MIDVFLPLFASWHRFLVYLFPSARQPEMAEVEEDLPENAAWPPGADVQGKLLQLREQARLAKAVSSAPLLHTRADKRHAGFCLPNAGPLLPAKRKFVVRGKFE